MKNPVQVREYTSGVGRVLKYRVFRVSSGTIDADDYVPGFSFTVIDKDLAYEIATAVNNHEALLAALKEMVRVYCKPSIERDCDTAARAAIANASK